MSSRCIMERKSRNKEAIHSARHECSSLMSLIPAPSPPPSSLPLWIARISLSLSSQIPNTNQFLRSIRIQHQYFSNSPPQILSHTRTRSRSLTTALLARRDSLPSLRRTIGTKAIGLRGILELVCKNSFGHIFELRSTVECFSMAGRESSGSSE